MFIIQIFYLSNLTVYASADGSGLNKQQPNRHNAEKEKIIKHEIINFFLFKNLNIKIIKKKKKKFQN